MTLLPALKSRQRRRELLLARLAGLAGLAAASRAMLAQLDTTLTQQRARSFVVCFFVLFLRLTHVVTASLVVSTSAPGRTVTRRAEKGNVVVGFFLSLSLSVPRWAFEPLFLPRDSP